MIKAGFVVRNKFQIAHFDALAACFPGADFLLYDRKGLQQEFSSDELTTFRLPVKLFKRCNVVDIISEYDVVFFQTVFPGVELIDRTPLVSVQYGLAKERHNYGEWRALADLNLMYGQYSVDAVSHYGPSLAVGNLKFCGWKYHLTASEKVEAKRKLGLDTKTPVVLFMPTYGELGSFNELVEPLAILSNDYQVLIKGHHNDEVSGAHWMLRARALGHKHLFSGGYKQSMLLEAADVVISDFSGAIFDAVYAKIPIVLFQSRAENRVGSQKFDLSSLEYRDRDLIGRVCTGVSDLTIALEDVVVAPAKYISQVADLRSDLFVDVSSLSAAMQAKNRVESLLSGEIPRQSRPQRYVREAIQRLLRAETELKIRRTRPSQRLLDSLRVSSSRIAKRLLSWNKS